MACAVVRGLGTTTCNLQRNVPRSAPTASGKSRSVAVSDFIRHCSHYLSMGNRTLREESESLVKCGIFWRLLQHV